MGQVSLTLPTAGSTPNSTADPEIVAALNALASAINGGLDASNLATSLQQELGVNSGTQKARGAFASTSIRTYSSNTFGTLTPADQVQGLVVPATAIVRVFYYGTLAINSGSSNAQAALFFNSTQVFSPDAKDGTYTNTFSPVATDTTNRFWYSLFTAPGCGGGLNISQTASTNLLAPSSLSGPTVLGDLNALTSTGPAPGPAEVGVLCPAGTYTVSVQFKLTGTGQLEVGQSYLFCKVDQYV